MNTGDGMRIHLKPVFASIAAVAMLSCGQDPDVTTAASVDTSAGSTNFESEGMNLRIEDVAQTGNVIWAMDFIDASTMIFTERQGRTRLLRLDTGEIRDVDGGPDVFAFDSGGLFDVLVDPEFETNGQLFWTYIKKVGDDSVTAVAKGRLQGDRIVDLQDLFVANNGSSDHAHWGSRIVIDRDRYLYFSVGERHVPDNAQNLASHGGKILRLTEQGGVPSDNPFAGREEAAPEIWSYGHRNPQGLAIQPESGRLFEQEHGPTGGDEINVIEKGKNYGWPVVTYGTDIWGGQQATGTASPGMEQPVKYFDPSIAPSGMTFYYGDRFAAWQGNLFSSTLRGHLNRLVLDGQVVVSEERLLNDWTERVRDVAEGPDGSLYLATESGRIARIVPAQ
jgi:glucose/arabinose dehydrogenase